MSYTASYIVNSSSAQGTTDFQFTFPYIKEEHIEVYLNYSKITQGSGSNQYQVITNVSPKLIRLNTGIASANLRVEVRRNSSLGSPLVDYADGSTLTANDLDTSALQSLYIDQELKDNQGKTVSVDETTGLPELNNLRLTNVADPTAAQDAATKNYVDTKQFTSAQIQDGTLVNADVNASAAIDGTKISPNFGSQNIVTSGTVDGRDVSNDGIKLDSIETGATADQTNAEIRAAVEAASDSNVFTDADHSKLNAIEAGATADQTNAEIRAAVEAASDSNVFTDADHSKLNAIEASATADQTSGEIKTLLQSDKLTASEIADGTITSTQIATGALDGRYYTETESDARYFNISSGETIKDGDTFPDNDTTIATTAAINDRIIDLVDDVGGFVPIANETSFPNANPDVNNGTGTIVSIGSLAGNLTSNGSGVITIANGTVGNSTVTITGAANSTTYSAGYGLLVETTSTLNTYTFHRLSSKATEVSTVAGNISNINAVANNASNINSAVSNASNINSAVSNASNINSAVSNASNINTVAGNNTNINTVAGANSNISTVAGSISNVNTVGGSISNVNTVATNISNVNDFSDKYRVASSAPTSNNDTGDLYFDTSANELKVYNGSAWQGGVTATGNLAGLGANTFTGNQSLGDNNKVIFGTGSDLQIYHDGTASHIANTTGDLKIDSDSIKIRQANQDAFIKCQNTATELYFDDSKKFETTSGGAKLSGHLTINNSTQSKILLDTADGSDDRWLNINGGGDASQSRGAGLAVYGNEASGSEGKLWLLAGNSGNTNGTIDFSTGGSVRASITNDGHFKIPNDSGRIKLGTSADLQIYHDGTDSRIQNSTGDLFIRTVSSGDDILLDSVDDIFLRVAGTESGIEVLGNSSTKLFYDNSKKLETKSSGIDVTGSINATGQVKINDSFAYIAGTGNDLQIYHNGTNSWIKSNTGVLFINTDSFRINNQANDESLIRGFVNGAVELYYDHAKKIETTSTGATITGSIYTNTGGGAAQLGTHLDLGDNQKVRFGASDDLQIYHDGSTNIIDAATSNAISFRRGGSEQFFIGNAEFKGGDNKKIKLGTGDDLELWHDGSNSYITNTTGHINIQSKQTENSIVLDPDGAVHLYYDNSKKLETTSGGVNVTGALTVNGSALSSAPQITATANGSISANEAVIVESDGKVAGVTGYSFGEGSNHVFTSSMGGNNNNHFDSDRSHGSQGLILYENSSSNRWYLKVATFSGTSITYNTGTMVKDSAFGTHGAVANVSAGVYVIVYNSGGGEYARVVTVSGSGSSATVTLGSELSFSESGSNNMQNVVLLHMRNTSNKLILAYHDNYNGSGEGRVLTVGSGTGSSASVSTSGLTRFNNNRPYNMKGTYDTTNNVVAVTYTQGGTTAAEKIHAFKLDGSGNFSAGNVQSAFSFNCYGVDIVYDSVNNMPWALAENSGNNYKYVKSLQYNTSNNYYTALGNQVSIGGSSTSADQGSHRIGFDSNTGTIAVFFSLNDSLFMDYGKINSSNQVSFTNSPVTVTTNMTSSLHVTGVKGALSNGRIPVLFREESDDDGVMRVRQFAGTDMTTENFIGFSSAAYSNGNTATINVVGATSTQSSLTPGQKYYVQNDGSLGLTAGDPNVYAGIAIATNNLLIKG